MLKARFVQIVSHEVNLVRIWNEPKCPSGLFEYHRAELKQHSGLSQEEAHKLMGIPDVDDPIRQDPRINTCQRCGATAPPDPKGISAGAPAVYNTASGRPEPGDLFWCDWYPCNKGGKCIYGWTNCDGKHLMAILPNGYHWDIDSRASNCTMPDDTTHRCWIRKGTPPDVHVDKSGLTCAAGAGSIAVPGYHGFLHNGHFT